MNAKQAKGYEIDRRKINLKDVIKETGEYTVPVKLHREVTLNVPVTVTAEGGAATENQEKAAARVEETAQKTSAESEQTPDETSEASGE